jgi:hypothetical protein
VRGQPSGQAREGAHLGGGGIHGGARQGRLGMARGRGGRCLNRAARLLMTSTTKMLPWYDAPQPACVRPGPQTDRWSALCTTHVRRDGGETCGARVPRRRGALEPGEGARPWSACGLGRCGAGADVETAWVRGRDVAAQNAAWRRLARTRFAEPLFEHTKLQNFE